MENIEVEGIFTHFHSADDSDLTSAHKQKKLFSDFLELLHSMGVEPKIAHASNSAGIVNGIGTDLDMVRCGITMYGIAPSSDVDLKDFDYRPALSIYSTITYIKRICAGESVSYGATFTAKKDMKVATISFGYADGYPRPFSANAKVIVNGVVCPIAGNICMDQCMVDVSAVPNVKLGDEVIVMGSDGVNSVTADDIANATGTINCEICCAFGQRLPKVYVD